MSSKLMERILASINISSTGCWEWNKYLNEDGYGKTTYKRKGVSAHRLSMMAHGRLSEDAPSNMYVDHICKNRSCVNPEHLRLVTPRESSLENCTSPPALNAKKTHCPHGHAFDEINTYRWRGERLCRACISLRQKIRYQRKKMERSNA